MSAQQPFAVAAILETDAKMDNGDGGLAGQLQFMDVGDGKLRGYPQAGDDEAAIGSRVDVKQFTGAKVGESLNSSSSNSSHGSLRTSSQSGKSGKSSDGSRSKSSKNGKSTSGRSGQTSPSNGRGGRNPNRSGRNPVPDGKDFNARKYRETRIIGGQEAQEDLYSFTVALVDSLGFFCGGSLIARDVVLTAAHCQGAPFDIVVGRHDLKDNDGEVIPINKQQPHPEYNDKNTDNDFMLVFLTRPISVNVELVKLNVSPSVPSVGDRVTVMGWGDTDIRDDVSTLSDVLMKVSVKVISNLDCEESKDAYDSYYGQITENMLCAKANLQDSCQGDSGGPLVLLKDGGKTQIGVVSWGIGCASEHFPGVYARMSRAYPWIETSVCEGSRFASEAGFNCEGKDEPVPSPTPQSNGFKPSGNKPNGPNKPTKRPRRKPSKKPSGPNQPTKRPRRKPSKKPSKPNRNPGNNPKPNPNPKPNYKPIPKPNGYKPSGYQPMYKPSRKPSNNGSNHEWHPYFWDDDDCGKWCRHGKVSSDPSSSPN